MDYEIQGYDVEYAKSASSRFQHFDIEDEAIDFAREKYSQGYTVTIVKKSVAINWI